MFSRASDLIAFVVCFSTIAPAAASTATFAPKADSGIPHPAGREVYLWLQPGRSGAPASEALSILEEAPSHGLRAEDYRLDELRRLHERVVAGEHDARVEYEGLMTDALLRLFKDLRPQLAQEHSDIAGGTDLFALLVAEAVNSDSLRDFYESLIPRHVQYERLRSALSRAEHAARLDEPAAIGHGRTLRIGDAGPRVRALRVRLLDAQHHQRLFNDVFDATLEDAVRRYQLLHGLEADGIVGKRTQQHLDMTAAERAARIRVALAQWRELPVALGQEYVHVNVPEYRLEMIRDGQKELEMRVVVGSKDDPTPTFNDEIEYLVFNPYWHVPRRIALEELVPKAAGSPGYLTSQNYEVLDEGKLVAESSVDWAAMDTSRFGYRIRQRPGPGNALGAVKFLFPNPMNIYLHDSPARNLYEHTVRAFSHGCIRLEQPEALAAALLEGQGDWNADRIERTMSKGSRRQVNLDRPVPVYLTYITARVTESGELALFQDVYDRDAPLLARYR